MNKSKLPQLTNLKVYPAFMLALICLCGICTPSLALPDDMNQEAIIEFSSSELFIDEGRTVFYGNPEQPARITQGSLVITGLEISMIKKDGILTSINAKGNPAQFQQQPEIAQAIIYASGDTIHFDNSNQLLTVDVNAEFSQNGNTLNGFHIDYNLETRRANATSENNIDQVRMRLPPKTDSGQTAE